VIQVVQSHGIPVQIDNTQAANQPLLQRIHHIWTPDIRIMHHDGVELYRFEGFAPPPEFMARTLCGYAMAYLRTKRFDQAEAIYTDVLTRFSTTFAAAEAQYYLGVAQYRRDPDSDGLLDNWAQLRSRYPMSEFRMKQSFKDLPAAAQPKPAH